MNGFVLEDYDGLAPPTAHAAPPLDLGIVHEVALLGAEGKVLVDRDELGRALLAHRDADGTFPERWLCNWPDCSYCQTDLPRFLKETATDRPHSGTCPLREDA